MVIFEQFLNSNIQWSLKNWKTVDTHKEFKAIDSLENYFNKPRIKTIVHGNNYFRDNAFTINNFLNWEINFIMNCFGNILIKMVI